MSGLDRNSSVRLDESREVCWDGEGLDGDGKRERHGCLRADSVGVGIGGGGVDLQLKGEEIRKKDQQRRARKED